MWRRLAMLVLCGLPALWADVCDSLPAGPPKWSEYWPGPNDDPRPLSFRLSVNKGGPAFRITVRPFSREIFSDFDWLARAATDNEGKNLIVELKLKVIHAGDIEVARCQDGKQLQSLPIMAWQPIDFGASFHAEDINFDGYLDFSVLTEFAAGYRSRSYWVYEPESGTLRTERADKGVGRELFGRRVARRLLEIGRNRL